MPDQVDMAGILLELNQVAEDSGITFEQITPATTATPISGYLAIPITVEFQGNFYDLSDFLYRLRNLVDVRHGTLDATGRLFAIDEVDFAEAPPPPGFPADPCAPGDRRVRLRHGHRPDRRACDRRHRDDRSDRRHGRDRSDAAHDPGHVRRERLGRSGGDLEHGEEDRSQGEGQAAEDLSPASAACSCWPCSPSRSRARSRCCIPRT